jgi:hypothetical protein
MTTTDESPEETPPDLAGEALDGSQDPEATDDPHA